MHSTWATPLSFFELARRVTDRIAIAGGVGYQTHDGKTVEGFAFGDLDVTPVWVGGTYRLLDASRWRVEALAQLGGARLSAVDVSFEDMSVRYWESSWVSLWGVGAGVSFHGDGPWSASLRAAYRSTGKPDAAFGEPSEAGSAGTLPLSLTVRYTFR